MTSQTAEIPSLPETLQTAPERARSRQAALSTALANLRTRRGDSASVAKVMRTVGAICLPLGIISILAGWYGSAHTGNLYEQNDYMISGGILGLALVFTGGFLYFSYWLTRQLEVTKTTQQQASDSYEHMQEQLAQLTIATTALAAAVRTIRDAETKSPRTTTRAKKPTS